VLAHEARNKDLACNQVFVPDWVRGAEITQS